MPHSTLDDARAAFVAAERSSVSFAEGEENVRVLYERTLVEIDNCMKQNGDLFAALRQISSLLAADDTAAAQVTC